MDAGKLELRDLIRTVERRCAGPPLERLSEAVRLSLTLTRLSDDLVEHFVQEARTGGASWSQVGTHLGVTKQAAHQRHTGRPGLLRRRPPDGDGAGPFERFTTAGRDVVAQAQAEARSRGDDYMGTEHLLLGLFHQADTIAARVLRDLGLTAERVRGELLTIVGEGSGSTAGPLRFLPRAKKVLEIAVREARAMGDPLADTEHLLLALTRESAGVGPQILAGAGVGQDDLRRRVLAIRAKHR